MISSATVGFPRIGPNREMKKSLEAFWKGQTTKDVLISNSNEIELSAWAEQAAAGLDFVALDGTLYDQVLDFAVMYLGLVPERFKHLEGLDLYFACCRGRTEGPALDMSKFFDTNYHCLIPEVGSWTEPRCDWSGLLDKLKRGQAAIGKKRAVPLLLGPVTIASLCKSHCDVEEMAHLLAPLYHPLLEELENLGVPEVQIHEPVLATSKALSLINVTRAIYNAYGNKNTPIHIVVPYDDVHEAVYCLLVDLEGIAGVGFDFCSAPGTAGNSMLDVIKKHGFPKSKRLGLGVVDGRSIWLDSEGRAVSIGYQIKRLLGTDQNICIQSSTSLQHVPYNSRIEKDLDPELRSKLSFAVQKLEEIASIASMLKHDAFNLEIMRNKTAYQYNVGEVGESLICRSEPYERRREKQEQYLAFPTSTIGSFPQTQNIRSARLKLRKGEISIEKYREVIASEIGYAIGVQEGIGLDVLVHGEAERTDMVEFFGVKLDGFAFTTQGWVQSYGSRYVRPPIIHDDVSRTESMTLHEFLIAQNLTAKPVKGMLTGPVTILNWSFPRTDISRAEQAMQIAFAIRQEVDDLQKNGCRIIQVDEPALREGLPLKEHRKGDYLNWATRAFRLATSIAMPEIQIVTHLCYSEFEQILGAIDSLDADVLTIENSRSDDEMIRALSSYGYQRDIGPGVYDIHSPVVPTVDFILRKIESFVKSGILKGDRIHRIHVNPDCGLKTRRWEEVIPSLRNMVEAAKAARTKYAK